MTNTVRTGVVVAAEFESVTISAEIRCPEIVEAVPERPAIGDNDSRIGLPQVPAIVGILPRAAAHEHITRARRELASKSIRIAALFLCRGIRRRIEIPVGIAVEDQIISSGSMDVNAGILAPVCNATLDNI